MSAIEIVNKRLRQIHRRDRCQNSGQELVDVERHGDTPLPGKQIHGRAYLGGNRGDDLLVSLGNVLIQTRFLGCQLLLQTFSFRLLGLNCLLINQLRLHEGFDFIGERGEAAIQALKLDCPWLEFKLYLLRRIDIDEDAVLLVAEHASVY